MRVAFLALFAVIGWQDPAALVKNLGSARFAEREDAETALRKLGRDALPALRKGAVDADLEIRTRAGAILSEIVSRLMVEPTLVRLDFRDQTVSDVVRSLSEQSLINLTLMPEDHPLWREKRVSLEASDPVPLWEALERLCQSAEVQIGTSGIQMMVVNGQPARTSAIYLQPASELPAPSAISGAFRASVMNVQHQKNRMFGQGQAGMVVNPNGVILRRDQRPAEPAEAVTRSNIAGFTTEVFSVGIQVSAEPRMSIVLNGPVQVLEAVDEQGRSLAIPEDPSAAPRHSAMGGYSPFGGPLLQFQVPLRLPATPGASVKTLRLSIPVVAAARKDDPFVVPLADAKGKTFEDERIIVQIHDVRPDPNRRSTTIELTVRIRSDDSGNPNLGRQAPEALVFRNNAGGGQNQFEIVDAQGRAYTQWISPNPQPGKEGLRMTLRLAETEGVGPPAELRYYNIARTETEVTFELSEIPMP
jgi:hypothetical protein